MHVHRYVATYVCIFNVTCSCVILLLLLLLLQACGLHNQVANNVGTLNERLI